MSGDNKLYKDIEYCHQELRNAREGFGSTQTTKKGFENIVKSLTIMYLHCPVEVQDIVEYTLSEAIMRGDILFGAGFKVEKE